MDKQERYKKLKGLDPRTAEEIDEKIKELVERERKEDLRIEELRKSKLRPNSKNWKDIRYGLAISRLTEKEKLANKDGRTLMKRSFSRFHYGCYEYLQENGDTIDLMIVKRPKVEKSYIKKDISL
jgi:hypothetical protein